MQLALAAFWAIDALLQLQPENFTKSLIFSTILGNAENQPEPISNSLVWASHLLGPYPVELNAAIISVQLLIAAGLVWPRTIKPALGLSIGWALGVWWLGEGFGGIFAGKATLLVGAPGPGLLYAMLALIAWPARRRTGSTIAAAGALGERATRGLWALLWIGGAVLRVVPFWFPPVYALSGDFELGLNQEPQWLFRMNETLSHLAAAAGLPLVIAIATIEAVIGIGALIGPRRVFLAMGILLAAIYWVVGQQLAQLLTGEATDVATGPLYILLALTLWPRPRYRKGVGIRVPARDPALAGHHVSASESCGSAPASCYGGLRTERASRSLTGGRAVAVLAPLADDPLDRLRASGDLQAGEGDLGDLPQPLSLPGSESPSSVLARLRRDER